MNQMDKHLRFLFVGPGYPGTPGTSSGSGIGTYMREIALGLTARGHECHVVVWSEDGCSRECDVDGVSVHMLPQSRWRVVERWRPDARKMWSRGRLAARLDRQYGFDWIEIQSDEGIDLAVQRRAGNRAILRIHTSLVQMCDYKQVPSTWWSDYYLARERESVRLAQRVVTHSALHAKELGRLFPELPAVQVVPHGFGLTAAENPTLANRRGETPRFLVVGTLDRRKGSDRLKAVLTRYVEEFGPCELRLVSPTPQGVLGQEFGLSEPYPMGLTVRYRTGISAAELEQEYRSATAYLHLARYESFGYPLIEAAAQGAPVVATTTGIAPDLLTGRLGSLLVDGDNPADCARAMHSAVTQRLELSELMFQTYRSGFTRDHMTERYLRMLRDLQRTEDAVGSRAELVEAM
jgi:glycosyltransferase involved in cell wall biosynthesis